MKPDCTFGVSQSVVSLQVTCLPVNRCKLPVCCRCIVTCLLVIGRCAAHFNVKLLHFESFEEIDIFEDFEVFEDFESRVEYYEYLEHSRILAMYVEVMS